ncbi:MAG: hypothetical protein PS018_16930 [bacterium]|nr:hypothetical protein [bacterium]
MNDEISIMKDADLNLVSGGFSFQIFGYKVEVTQSPDRVMPSGRTVHFDPTVSIVKV